MKSQPVPEEIKRDKNRSAKILVQNLERAKKLVGDAYNLFDTKNPDNLKKARKLFIEASAFIPTYSKIPENEILFNNMHKEINDAIKEIDKIQESK